MSENLTTIALLIMLLISIIYVAISAYKAGKKARLPEYKNPPPPIIKKEREIIEIKCEIGLKEEEFRGMKSSQIATLIAQNMLTSLTDSGVIQTEIEVKDGVLITSKLFVVEPI